jgi:hypothetical protein
MKQKNLSFLITFLLLSSMTFSLVVSVKADYTFDYDNTFFDYGVSEGDVFEYNMKFDFNFTASNTFYDVMDTWIVEQAAAEDIGFSLEGFSLAEIVNDLETFLSLDYKLQLEIKEMFSEKYKYTYTTGDWEERYWDYFNGSVRADLGAGWETPEVIAVDKLEDSKAIVVDYLNETEYAYYVEMVDEQIAMLEDTTNQPDWDNVPFYQVSSTYMDYNSDGTLKEDVSQQLLDGTPAPLMPFSEFGGLSGLPLFFPEEMNFQEFYDYGTELFEFQLLAAIENSIIIDPLDTTDTLQSVLAKGGVSEIHVDEKSVSFVWNLANVDPELLDLSTTVLNLTEVGIVDHIGTIALAAEYDNDWALETFTAYAHVGLTLDTTTISGAPNINNEVVSFDIAYSIAREGVTPPTEEDILGGLIGGDSAFEIPGFPIWIVGLFGLISIAALVVKHRK